MARLSVLATAVAGALHAVTSSAAPALLTTLDTPETCDPTVCMSVAIWHSQCFDGGVTNEGLNPGPLMPNGVNGMPPQWYECVCKDEKAHKDYIDCYGMCELSAATEPFCKGPVKEIAHIDKEEVAKNGPTARSLAPLSTTPDQCNPMVCMSLAIVHSDCFHTASSPSLPLMPTDIGSMFSEMSSRVCGDKELMKNYLSCYGFCTIDPDHQPFCKQPIDEESHEDSLAARDNWNFHQHAPPTCTGPNCDKWDPKESGMIGFCGVPGQQCGKYVDTDADAEEDIDEEVPEVDLTARDDWNFHQHAPPTCTGPNCDKWDPKESGMIGFCGVPGQQCGKFVDTDAEEGVDFASADTEKAAIPTRPPGSDFVDVGDVQSQGLEGRIGSGVAPAM